MTPQVGPYQLIKRLAVGGMGEVFLAQHTGPYFTRDVALKRILPHLMNERHFIDQFIDEAHLMTRLHHGNILSVYELCQDEWGLYMVMEFLQSVDIRSLNRKLSDSDERWPTEVAVWVIAEVCAGLDYAHQLTDEEGVSLDLIHRDISPSNILLGFAGEVKLIDFGVARALGGLHKSVAGRLQGKLAYLSPEQARGETLTTQSDVFSLGVVLYEMLSRQRIWMGETDAELLQSAQEGALPPLGSAWSAGPDALCSIIDRSLALDRELRYATAGAFGEALRGWLSSTKRAIDHSDLKVWLSSRVEPLSSGALSLDEAMDLHLASAHSGTPSAPRVLEREESPVSPVSLVSPVSPLSSPSSISPKLEIPRSSAHRSTQTFEIPRSSIEPPVPSDSPLPSEASFQETLNFVLRSSPSLHRPLQLSQSALSQRDDLPSSPIDLQEALPNQGLDQGLDLRDSNAQKDRAREPHHSRRLYLGFGSLFILLSIFALMNHRVISAPLLFSFIDDRGQSVSLSEPVILTVDDQPWSLSQKYEDRAPLHICVKATLLYEERCEWIRLGGLESLEGIQQSDPQSDWGLYSPKDQPADQVRSALLEARISKITLKRKPLLKRPQVIPIEARWTLNHRPLSDADELIPLNLRARYKLCAVIEGYRQECLLFRGERGVYEPQALQLERAPLTTTLKRADSSPNKEPAKMSVPTDSKPSSAKLKAQSRKSASSRVVTLMGHPKEAMIKCGARAPQKSTLKLSWTGALRCEVSALGYTSQKINLTAYKARVRFKLIPQGQLTVRALPLAAKLYLDGQEIPNPSKSISLNAGSHVVRGTLTYDGRTVQRVEEIEVTNRRRRPLIIDLTQELKSAREP